MPHQGQSTHKSAPPVKGIPPYSCCEGDPSCHWSVSSSGMLRTGTKTSSSWMRNFSPLRSSITTRTIRFMLKMSLEVHSKGAGMPSPFLHHGLVGGVPSGGDTFIFARNGWNWCPSVSRGRATRSCETA